MKMIFLLTALLALATVNVTVAEVSRTSTDTPEQALQRKIHSKEIQLRNLNQNFTHQNNTYRVSDFDKVIGENIETIFRGFKPDEAKQFAQNYLMLKSRKINSATPSPEKNQMIRNLEKMYGYIYADKGKEELGKALQCDPSVATLQPVQDFIESLEDTRSVALCAPLNPGQHKVFKKDNEKYYSTGNYLLKRRMDGNFQAIVNVNFIQAAGIISPLEMMERTKKCLAEASPALKGPNNEQLEMIVLTPEETKKLPSDERPEPHSIKIEGPQFRSNADSYSQNINCATIIHEVLHLLGLCDEYQEKRAEFAQQAWNCRVVTKAPSIMRELRTYEKAVGETIRCDCSGQTCRTIMNSSNENLKKFYTSIALHEASDFHFRTAYCKNEFLPAKSGLLGDRALKKLQESETLLVIENRVLSPFTSAPFYKIYRSKVTCECPPQDASCKQELLRISQNIARDAGKTTCPADAKYLSTEPGGKFMSGLSENNILQISRKPELPSLLQPNQFHKILEGNCPGQANGYRTCAEFAYKKEPCQVPEECKSDSYYLGSKQ
jgi:hypothetical protein